MVTQRSTNVLATVHVSYRKSILPSGKPVYAREQAHETIRFWERPDNIYMDVVKTAIGYNKGGL